MKGVRRSVRNMVRTRAQQVSSERVLEWKWQQVSSLSSEPLLIEVASLEVEYDFSRAVVRIPV